MFHYEMEDTDDINTLDPIDYESELLKVDEKLTENYVSFCRKAGKDLDDIKLLPENMLEVMKRKRTQLSGDSEQIEVKTAQFSRRSEELAKMKQEVEKARESSSGLVRSVEELTRRAGERETRLAARRSEAGRERSLAEEERRGVSGELERFKETLGLELVSSTHGGTLFIFTNVDRNEPDKKFSFELAVGQSRCYPSS